MVATQSLYIDNVAAKHISNMMDLKPEAEVMMHGMGDFGDLFFSDVFVEGKLHLKVHRELLRVFRGRDQNHIRIAADEATTQWAWCLCASSSLRQQMPMYTALSCARIPRSSQTVIHRISPMVSS